MAMLVNKKDVMTSRFIDIEDTLETFRNNHDTNEKVVEVGKDHLIVVNDPFVYVKELGLIMAPMTYLTKVDEMGYAADFDGTAIFSLHDEKFVLSYFEQDSMLITAVNYTGCNFDTLTSAQAIVFTGTNFAAVCNESDVQTVERDVYVTA